MEKARTNGQMGGSTREVGNIMIWMDTESSLGMMAEYIKAPSKRIRDMGKEYNNGQTVESTMDNGNMVSSMERLGTRV